jgi:NADH dehydrogenase
VRTGQSVSRADATGVLLTTGEYVATHSLIWCVGVRPGPLVEDLGLPTERGRLTVGADLQVPGHPEVFAAGDCAGVPDLTRPGNLTGMTAQHAQRQGKRVAASVIASLRGRPGREYRHRDLGFIVDLGGADAAADPLGLALSGLPAKTVTRAYHLYSMPGNRIRTFTDWALNTVLRPPPPAELGLVRAADVPLTEAGRTGRNRLRSADAGTHDRVREARST